MPVVLVVEHVAHIRFLVVEALNDYGLETLGAGSAFEAHKFLKERNDIAIVFTDINLAGDADGLRLAWAVSSRFSDVVILVTAAGRLPVSIDLPPGSQFLAKPYLLNELSLLVQNSIPSRQIQGPSNRKNCC